MAGARYERQLVRALTSVGVVAMRAPTSGSATDRNLPDVLAGEAYILEGSSGAVKTLSDCWAIELKTSSGTTAYAEGEEISSVGAFAQQFGASPLIAARFKREGGSRSPFYLVEPADARQTDGGNYGIPESDADERARAILYPETDAKDASLEVSADG